MTAIHHVLDSLAPNDAISDEVRALREALRVCGVGGGIHAVHVHPSLRTQALPLERLPRGGPVLLHHSIGSAAVEAALDAADPLLVRYQNVTPARYFRAINDALADASERGRADLGRIALRAALVVAPSSFSAAEARAAGASRVDVVPILLPERDAAAPVPRSTSEGGPLILSIGRIAPHKRIDEVLRVFACYRRGCEPAARLALVGSDAGFEPYGRACRTLAERLGLGDSVRFEGVVSEDAKGALLAEAAAYLACTEHEGFCVPLVEAMRAGVPIVARAEGAVAETVGSGGVAVATGDHAVLAELLHAVAGLPAARAAARSEARRYEPERVGEALVSALTAALR